MKKVLFIFDRVMHYHLDLFRSPEERFVKSWAMKILTCISGRSTVSS